MTSPAEGGGDPRRGLPLRVLDLADASGVFCGRLFVGLGAEVIRLEPSGGDPLRAALPRGVAFAHWNAGKRSVSLDLGREEGRALFHRLAATADVLVVTPGPGDPGAPELEPEALGARHPRLVVVSITPFGRTGPRARWRGTNLTQSALGGMMALCGEPDGPPLQPPCEQAFHLAGVHGAIGALLGIRARRLAGRGQVVDVSVQEAVASTLEFGAIGYIHTGRTPRRQGSRYPFVPHALFPVRDGLVAGGIGGSPRMWDDLVRWLDAEGKAADLTDPAWQDDAVRLRGRERVFQVLEGFTAGFSKATFYHEAQRRRLPWAPVDRPEDVARNPQLAARGFFVETIGDVVRGRDVGFAFGFPEGARPASLAVPACGEANAEILGAELGCSPAELARLAAAGIV